MLPREGFIVIVVESSGLLRIKVYPTLARKPIVLGVVGVEGIKGMKGIRSVTGVNSGDDWKFGLY